MRPVVKMNSNLTGIFTGIHSRFMVAKSNFKLVGSGTYVLQLTFPTRYQIKNISVSTIQGLFNFIKIMKQNLQLERNKLFKILTRILLTVSGMKPNVQ